MIAKSAYQFLSPYFLALFSVVYFFVPVSGGGGGGGG